MRAFLTGGTGFIGLALTERLLREGIEVLSTAETEPPAWAIRAMGDGVVFRTIDIRDRDALSAALEDWQPDLLIHGAALTPDTSRERAGNAAAIFEINVAGTANAIECAAAAGVGRVIAFSSGAAYGRTIADTDVLDEDVTECQPATLYAISKLAAEKTALRLGDLYGLSVATPRLSAAWGPWEYRTPHRQTLSAPWQIIEAVRHGIQPIVSVGAALPLVFSDDAADMLMRLALKDEATGVFNVGSSTMINLDDFAKTAQSFCEQPTGAATAEIDLFVAGRPPMRMNRLSTAIGEIRHTETSVALQRTFDWYASACPD